MKFKKLPILLIAVLMLGFVFIGCENQELKTDENNSESLIEQVTSNDLPDLKIEDGILYFENNEEMILTLEILNSMSENEIKNWEASIGFQSMQRLYDEAYNEIDEAKSENELLAIVEKYNDLFYIDKNEIGEKELFEKIKINKQIQNEDMIYRIGDDLFKILPNYIVSCKYEYLSELKNISEKAENSPNFIFSEIVPLNNTKTANNYGASTNVISGKKQCYFDLYTYISFGVDNYYTTMYVSKYMTAKTYGKKKTFGIWRRYKTKLDIFFYNLYISCSEDPYQYLKINNTGWGTGVNKKREFSVTRYYAYYTASIPHSPSQDVFYKYKVRARNMDMLSSPVNVQYNQ